MLHRPRPRIAWAPGFALAMTLMNLCVSSAAGAVPGGELQLMAGDLGDAAAVDGSVAVARFNGLAGLAVDESGTVYVSDGHAIRKLSTDGAVTTLAGRAGEWGDRDGPGTNARFNNPQGLAADAVGNVYVADRDNHTIRKITPAGVVSTVAGSAGSPGARDGIGSRARFFKPTAIAVDGSGALFVSDTYNFTIRKISLAGVVSTLAGRAGQDGSDQKGRVDGPAAAARFKFPQGIAVDAAGNVYVADDFAHTIRKISARGVVTTVAGQAGAMGSADGVGASSRFAYPSGLAIDSGGTLYVADSHSLTIRKITSNGTVTTIAGRADHPGIDDGPGAIARFNGLAALAADRRGNVYVTDVAYLQGHATTRYVKPGPSATVRRIDTSGRVSTVAGRASPANDSPDGMGSAARFESPSGIAADRAGTLYVVDTTASTLRKITASGQVTTLAGKAGVSGHQDGPGGEALLNNPSGVVLDGAGTLYITDTAASVIRKVTRDGLVSTLAGTPGVRGNVDGVGAAARFSTPTGIAIDHDGNLLVTDGWANNIRKITPAGAVTTWANRSGQRGFSDGPVDQARFVVPTGIAVDHAGSVYVCDYGNRTLRKITRAGLVSTLAGRAPRPTRAPQDVPPSADGTGAGAVFEGPIAVVVDDAGLLYVADGTTIRKVTPGGAVTTIAGVPGQSGIRLGPLPGRLENTSGLALLDSHTLAVTEQFSVLTILLDDH